MTTLQTAWEFISEWIFLLAPIAALQAILCITALVSIVRKKNVTRGEKLPWVFLAILGQMLGPIIYFVIGSNKLDEKAGRREEQE